MKDFVSIFQSEDYAVLARQLITDTHLDLEKDGTAAQFIASLEDAMKEVASLQAEGAPLVAYMSISVMYTQVYFNEFKLRLDFYSSEWPVTEPFYSTYINVDWLFTYWHAHEAAMEEAGKNQRAWIRQTHLASMRWQSVRLLAYTLHAKLKYWLQNFTAAPAFKMLQREAAFYILFGEYQDWQSAVFADLPPIDLFNCSTDDALRFRVYEKCRYSKKKFVGLDLSLSRFRDCTFENCTFDDVDLSDVTFDHCQFSHCQFTQVRLSGALFLGSRCSEVSFQETVTEHLRRNDGRNDTYRSLEFSDCTLENVRLINCQFPGALLTDSQLIKLTIDGGDFTNSDFQEFVTAQITKGGEV
ncbi:pentapeptide repeat-containing protein [Anaerosinus massiliensis]|uniref:pentapeptide repeat-containing protein n=1 Tax=Massilibacillus massiliensis TaxID=1806837 RepID=UPI000ABD318C|nr:pentapeptide repeat-containing protein [Massilibacillus massiliensis]